MSKYLENKKLNVLDIGYTLVWLSLGCCFRSFRDYSANDMQQKMCSQISLSAFEYLFSEFSSSFPATTNKFKNHCILACDGCHVVYTTNSEIIEDYNKPCLIDYNYKGYNHMHLNWFVVVISKAFLDIVIQPSQKPAFL